MADRLVVDVDALGELAERLESIRTRLSDGPRTVRLVREEDTKQAQSAPQKAPVKSDANVQRQPKKKSRKRH